jgi:hypothetical protein
MGAEPGPFSMLSIKLDTSEKKGSSSANARKGDDKGTSVDQLLFLTKWPVIHVSTHFDIGPPLQMFNRRRDVVRIGSSKQTNPCTLLTFVVISRSTEEEDRSIVWLKEEGARISAR